jgi:hypothetical protein
VSKPAEICSRRTRQPRLSLVATGVASAACWLLAAGGLIGTIYLLPQLGWSESLSVAALCAAPPSALWLTRRAIASWREGDVVPLPAGEQRYHGRLEVITDSERRSLRPIASTAYEVAARTGELLADLMAIPSVQIFRGVRTIGTDLPLIPHAINAGRQLVLIESVAWPPGHYQTSASGRIYCDGTYIGQSVRPFIAAAEHWRKALPRTHRVIAMIVVHTRCDRAIRLPTPTTGDLIWICAEDAAHAIRRCLLSGRQDLSKSLVAALISATADGAGGDHDFPAACTGCR